MNTRALAFLPPLLLPAVNVAAQTTNLRPPPLNPHPKEALHVTVSFDRPDDAKRYTVAMRALYQNQRSECGYVESGWNRRFIYPEGSFEIPNKSRDRRRAEFDIYVDRYNQEVCNWELAKPDFLIRESHTGMTVVGFWGLRMDLIPGAKYKAICPFRDSEHARRCFGRGEPVPDTSFFNEIPASRRVPVTVRVAEDSALMRPQPSSHFGNFVKPMTSGGTSNPPSMTNND
jgi:hypothetical protein